LSSQEAGCPVNELKTTNSDSSLVSHPLLNDYVTVGSNKVITAKGTLHQSVTFYMQVTAAGGKVEYFGPYEIIFGCFDEIVSITQAENFSNSISVFVGDVATYQMQNPTITRDYCQVVSNKIVTNDASGSTWVFPAKIKDCASQPCSSFSVNTSITDSYSFKVLTEFTNSLSKLSSTVNVVISCANNYVISEVSAATNPYTMELGDANDGFELPLYTSSKQTACPTTNNDVQLSYSGTEFIPVSRSLLLNPELNANGHLLVKPAIT
jgi:hypothetical protein